MTTINEARAVSAPVVSHVPWWRGKIVQVAAIAGVMWLAYRGWKSQYPWPNDLVWNGLQAHFDSVQTWLIDKRLEGGGGLLFTVFDGFRAFADNLVRWFNDLLVWMTWIGTAVAGTLVAWRFGGLRAGAWALARVRGVRDLRPLGGEHGDTRPDARGRRPLDPDRRAAGDRGGPLGRFNRRSRPSSTRRRSSPRSHT